ncbi:hypothetical protein [Nocardiopsis rhodophaea]|uniref:hypothetical protein n=1 Tax=Nocardiopsis rhodophaea TaxID=280238 RepID=UPI0031DD4660
MPSYLYREVHFSGFSLDIPPLWIELDADEDELEQQFRRVIEEHADLYLGDSTPGGLIVSGHPASANGIIRTKPSGNRRGSYLGSFSVQEGRPPLSQALRPKLTAPLVAAAVMGLLFLGALFSDDFDVSFSLAYVGRMLVAMLITAAVVAVLSVVGQIQDWRAWDQQ